MVGTHMSNYFRMFWKLIEDQRRRYGLALVALFFSSFFLYLVPLIPQITIDGVLTKTSPKTSVFVQSAVSWMGGRSWLADNLWLPALILGVFAVIAGVFTYLRGRWSAKASEIIILKLRDKVFNHLQHLTCSYFDEAETGDLIQRCTSDIETLRLFLSTQVVEIGRAFFMFLVPLPFMFYLNVKMTIVSMLLVPIIVAFSTIFFLKIKSVFQKSDESEATMTAAIQENLSGIRVVRAFSRQEFECEKFEKKNNDYRQKYYHLYFILGYFWSISDFLCFTQQALVVGAGIYWIAQGQLEVGLFFYFITVVSMFLWPVRMVGRIITEMGKAVVAMNRLTEILEQPKEEDIIIPQSQRKNDTKESVKEKDSGEGLEVPLSGEIEFSEVSFSHPDSDVLKGLSFTVTAGKTLAIVGPSGSGKSTIIQLLLRLYEYDQGSIKLDGRELNFIPRKSLRSQVAVVMQEPFLYSKTLHDNIDLGNPGSNENDVQNAAAQARVHQTILELDEGYDTFVGERGVTLSGGQRQRVALARALLQKPAILILDDATSAVDLETEEEIRKAFLQRGVRHTTIIIAHRLTSLMHADTIIVLDEGKVIQSGTHKTLLEKEGLYQRLWKLQSVVEDTDDADDSEG